MKEKDTGIGPKADPLDSQIRTAKLVLTARIGHAGPALLLVQAGAVCGSIGLSILGAHAGASAFSAGALAAGASYLLVQAYRNHLMKDELGRRRADFRWRFGIARALYNHRDLQWRKAGRNELDRLQADISAELLDASDRRHRIEDGNRMKIGIAAVSALGCLGAAAMIPNALRFVPPAAIVSATLLVSALLDHGLRHYLQRGQKTQPVSRQEFQLTAEEHANYQEDETLALLEEIYRWNRGRPFRATQKRLPPADNDDAKDDEAA